MIRRTLIPVFFLAAALGIPGAGAQSRDGTRPWSGVQDQDEDSPALGDTAAAGKYVEWVLDAISRDQWSLAEEALDRAADYADVSSDLSYLLALARSRLGRPSGTVLEALRRGLEAGRWNRYKPADARLLEAETLIGTRAYDEALGCLDRAGDSVRAISLRLLALRGLSDTRAFNVTMTQALDRYPRSPEPVRILFSYAADRIPGAQERELITLCLRRLPQLIAADGELAYLAVPFIRDTGEARRLVEAYRAAGGANPAAIPAALNLGLIDDERGVTELFQETLLDRDLLETVWGLLRSADGRRRFGNLLSQFSGSITEDIDRDGRSESQTLYKDGSPIAYSYDADQDGLPELAIFFSVGLPVRAELSASPEPGFVSSANDGEQTGFRRRFQPDSSPRISLKWEQYPGVLQAELEGVSYIPRPNDFFFKPLQFRDLLGSSLLYPERELVPRLSRRTLVSFALTIERPGREIPGSIERIEMNSGVPRRAREYLGEKLVSETEFLLGQPVVQRIDLDLDGRLETVRRFRRFDLPPDDPLAYTVELSSSESDWDGDGIYEYGESYTGNQEIRTWDMDKDGIKEYTETGLRN